MSVSQLLKYRYTSVFLAAMSSSRSDDVTQFVSLLVRFFLFRLFFSESVLVVLVGESSVFRRDLPHTVTIAIDSRHSRQKKKTLVCPSY